MKKIVFTQRVKIVQEYGERWDCADQKIAVFLHACGFLPVPVMNVPSLVEAFCDEIDVDGILLTGGNDLAAYGGNAPERDETERRLIRYAQKNGIPLLGICRGMQMIADFFGVPLENTEHHVRQNHPVTGVLSRESVNSYHRMGIRSWKGDSLEILATAGDGIVEAFRSREFRIAGIMWHPERVVGFDPKDIQWITDFYNGGKRE